MPLSNKDKHWLINNYRRKKSLKSPALTQMICDKYDDDNYVSRQAVHNLINQYKKEGITLLDKYPVDSSELTADKELKKLSDKKKIRTNTVERQKVKLTLIDEDSREELSKLSIIEQLTSDITIDILKQIQESDDPKEYLYVVSKIQSDIVKHKHAQQVLLQKEKHHLEKMKLEQKKIELQYDLEKEHQNPIQINFEGFGG
jgi:hypothetical protein